MIPRDMKYAKFVELDKNKERTTDNITITLRKNKYNTTTTSQCNLIPQVRSGESSQPYPYLGR